MPITQRRSLPSTISPTGKRCITLEIPDDDDFERDLVGALAELTRWNSWDGDILHSGRVVAKQWLTALRTIRNCGEPLPEDGDCIGYGYNAPFVEFAPQNPYTEPDYRPTGYNKPPFYIVKPDDPIYIALGYKAGDILTDITNFLGNFPEIIPTGGLPRIRVRVSGKGTIEFHYLNVPLGSFMLIQSDGLLSTISYVDTNLDVASLPNETWQEGVSEVSFDTEGEHFVDVTFVPKINDEIPFVNFGGGLRSIVLCGFDLIGDTYLLDVRQRTPDEPCKLDRTFDGATWTQFADLRLCPPKLRIQGGEIQYSTDDGTTWVDYPNDGTLQGGQPGEQAGGDTPLGAGECKSIRVSVKANEPTLIPFRVMPGDTISITSSGGCWQFNRSTFFGYRCPNGELFAFSGCNGDVSSDPTGTIDTLKAGRLIAQYGTTGYYDIITSATLPDGGTEQHLTLLMNDPDVSDNSGEIWAVVEVCSGEWCYRWDFSANHDNWETLIAGQWSANGAEATVQSGVQRGQWRILFDDTFVSTVKLGLHTLATDANANMGLYASLNGTIVQHMYIDAAIGFSEPTLNLGVVCDEISFYLDTANTSATNYAAYCQVNGRGVNPFGIDNCS